MFLQETFIIKQKYISKTKMLTFCRQFQIGIWIKQQTTAWNIPLYSSKQNKKVTF